MQPSSFLFDIRVGLLSVADKGRREYDPVPLFFCSVYIGEAKALLVKKEREPMHARQKF